MFKDYFIRVLYTLGTIVCTVDFCMRSSLLPCLMSGDGVRTQSCLEPPWGWLLSAGACNNLVYMCMCAQINTAGLDSHHVTCVGNLQGARQITLYTYVLHVLSLYTDFHGGQPRPGYKPQTIADWVGSLLTLRVDFAVALASLSLCSAWLNMFYLKCVSVRIDPGSVESCNWLCATAS